MTSFALLGLPTDELEKFLAGSHSDGLLTASITTPRFVKYSRNMMEEGARKAGKDSSELDLGSVIVGSVGEDPQSEIGRAHV